MGLLLLTIGFWWMSSVAVAAALSNWTKAGAHAAAAWASVVVPAVPAKARPAPPNPGYFLENELCHAWPFPTYQGPTTSLGAALRALGSLPFWDTPGVMFLPLQAGVCATCVAAFLFFGFPPVARPGDRRKLWLRVLPRVVVRSSWGGLLWLTIALFVPFFWYSLAADWWSYPRWRQAAVVPLLDYTPGAVVVPAWGALLGYLGSISRQARRAIWESVNEPAPVASWSDRCVKCGYPLVQAPCPECGEPDPRSVGFIYYHRVHARLVRNLPVDPVRVLHTCAVCVMLGWPLFSGVVRGLLGGGGP